MTMIITCVMITLCSVYSQSYLKLNARITNRAETDTFVKHNILYENTLANALTLRTQNIKNIDKKNSNHNRWNNTLAAPFCIICNWIQSMQLSGTLTQLIPHLFCIRCVFVFGLICHWIRRVILVWAAWLYWRDMLCSWMSSYVCEPHSQQHKKMHCE